MTPLPFVWNGEAMVIQKGFQRQADQQFCIGEGYRMAPVEDRSRASHDHFFAMLDDLHATLPEGLAGQFPTPESLRHFALCKSGFCDVETFVAASRKQAIELAAFVKKGAVIVEVDEGRVIRLTPHSQSMKAMGKERFQKSKEAVLNEVAKLLDVPADVLLQQRAAA